MYQFTDMELDDEDKVDLAILCTADSSKLMGPQYPWGLRNSLTGHDLEKLGVSAADIQVGGYIHGHFMARITSVSSDSRENGEKSERVEWQIEQLCIESEDAENEEAEQAEETTNTPKRRRLYG